MQTNYSNGLLPANASLLIDGGHFDSVMKKVIDNHSKKYGLNKMNVHLSVNMFLNKVEQMLNVKFDLRQKFYFQGTDSGKPNEFHKKLEDKYDLRVFIHGMKKQSGNKVREYQAKQAPAEVKPPVAEEQSLVVVAPEPTSVKRNPLSLLQCGITASAIVAMICTHQYIIPMVTATAVACVGFIELKLKGDDNDTIPPPPPPLNAPLNASTPLLEQGIVEPVSLYEKAKIWVERGVDIHIAVCAMECAYGLNGMINYPTIVFITGDSDFESAMICASLASNVIAISQDGAMSQHIERFAPKHVAINMEYLMEQCINVNYIAGPQAPAPVKVQSPIARPANNNNNNHNNIASALPHQLQQPPQPQPLPVKNNFAVTRKVVEMPAMVPSQVQKHHQSQMIAPMLNLEKARDEQPVQSLSFHQNLEKEKSGEFALALHHFIATKWLQTGKPFFLVDLGNFYKDDVENDVFRAYVKKTGLQKICSMWNELFSISTICNRGARIALSQSDRSNQLLNSYFVRRQMPMQMPMQAHVPTFVPTFVAPRYSSPPSEPKQQQRQTRFSQIAPSLDLTVIDNQVVVEPEVVATEVVEVVAPVVMAPEVVEVVVPVVVAPVVVAPEVEVATEVEDVVSDDLTNQYELYVSQINTVLEFEMTNELSGTPTWKLEDLKEVKTSIESMESSLFVSINERLDNLIAMKQLAEDLEKPLTEDIENSD